MGLGADWKGMNLLIDTELVERAVARDPGAVSAILGSLREHAWAMACNFTPDWDARMDLAQEILIEVNRSLPRLRNPERFESWCTTLGKRVCLAWKQKEKRRQVYLGNLRIEQEIEDPSIAPYPFSAPEDGITEGEQWEYIQVALAKMSRQSRKALELFYLDGLPLREIAVQLGMTENAVKQRLHWGRNTLKKEIWTMPVTSEERTKPAVEPLLRFSSWGHWDKESVSHSPCILTRPLLAQQILIEIARKPRTAQELATAVGAERIYVIDHLVALTAAELVRQVDEERYVADFFLLDEKAQEALDERACEVGRRDAEIVASYVGEVREAFEQCRFVERGFDWEYMRWIVLPVFVVSFGATQALSERFELFLPLRPDGGRWYFFGYTCDHPDFQWHGWYHMSHDNQRGGVGDFGAPALHKENVALPGPRGRPVLYPLVDGPKTLEEIEKDVGGDEVRERVAELIEMGFLAREGEKLRLAIPVFTEVEDRILHPIVARISQEVVERSHLPGMQGMDELLDSLGYGHLAEQYEVLIRSTNSDFLAHCIESLFEMGLLGEIPEDTSGVWGCWMWRGSLGLVDKIIPSE